MADAEAEAAARPEVSRVVPALRARLWQLQTELREQEVSEASSRAYCRGFCQVGGGRGGPRRGLRAGYGQRGCGRGRHGAGTDGAAALGARSPQAGGAQGSGHRARVPSGAVHALPGAPRGLCAASPEPGPSGLLAFGLCHCCGPGRPVALGWLCGAGGPHRIFSVQSWLGSETFGCLCFTSLGIKSAYSALFEICRGVQGVLAGL